MPTITVHPVTPERWPDFQRLFEARGGPHYCWCLVYRDPEHPKISSDERRDKMHDLVKHGTPIGLLAYDGDEPVGWCSVAPRESYQRLGRSRSMPRVEADDVSTWTVLCFFVRRDHRKSGVTKALIEGAVSYAKKAGAQVIEGYPWDTAGISSTHRGHSAIFRDAGFERDGKRWVVRV